jgi:hypothetical protein
MNTCRWLQPQHTRETESLLSQRVTPIRRSVAAYRPKAIRSRRCVWRADGELVEWARHAAYIAGTVYQELRLRNGPFAGEIRMLRSELKGCLMLSDGERPTLRRIGLWVAK